MRKRYKSGIVLLLLSAVLAVGAKVAVAAAETPDIRAEAYALMEQETGKLLYLGNADKRMYPASLTKIMTAILCLDYIGTDEVVIAGEEINSVPYDSSKAGHEVGEAITGENLIRGLIIPSGNETACIVAMEVAKRYLEDDNISYGKAEQTFCELMNEKARELGSTNTNFTNPHGYHNDNHYTTAHDMALITREAMTYGLIAEIALETEYSGFSAGNGSDPSINAVEHSWKSHNELIINGENYYPYATGLKTGRTSMAGECLAATATKDGQNMIVILFDSLLLTEDELPTRWEDSERLFDYGFNNFDTRVIQTMGELLGSVKIAAPRLGDPDTLEYVAAEDASEFLSFEQLDSTVRDITLDASLMTEVEQEDGTVLIGIVSPVTAGQALGVVAYSLNGEVIYSGDVLATGDVLERTFNSDVDYYMAAAKAAVFSLKAIPFWVAAIALIILVIVLTVRARNKRRRNYFTLRKRY